MQKECQRGRRAAPERAPLSRPAWAGACMLALAAVCAPLSASAQTPPQTPPAAAPADTFADATARELVRQARIRRGMVDLRIAEYRTQALERISLGLGTPLGERLLYRRETASQISWTRDSVHVHVLGAREVVPQFRGAPQIPQDLSRYMPSLAFDPVDSDMLLRLDDSSLRHPLAHGHEQHYRYATGDSTVIRLPDGRAVRLRELRVLPRRADPELITGSLWLDMETHAVVQAYVRLARGYDSRRDADGSVVPITAELDYIAIDYGLWDMRWWLPHLVAARGVARVAGVRIPMSFERRYDDYTVLGDTTALPTLAALPDSLPPRLCRPPTMFAITVQPSTSPLDTMSAATAARIEARQDSVRRERQDSVRRERRAARGDTATAAVCDRVFTVTREDHPDLLASELLPGDIYATESPVIDPARLRALEAAVRMIPGPPWRAMSPLLEWPLNSPGLVRYNRVEGVSLGARVQLDVGRLSADAGARVGTAGGEVGAELGLSRSGERLHSRLAGYRRVDVFDAAATPFTLGSSLSALLLARDEHDYFRASGAELRLRPPDVRPQWYDVRLFAERQAPLTAHADFSVAGLIDSGRDMRPNLAADAADQLGATLRLRSFRGFDPAAFRWGAELELHGETGDYDFVRPALRLRAGVPLGGRIALGAELAGGTSVGDLSAQRLWQLGGVGTLRGYDPAAARGDTFWRGRAELGYGLPFARLVTFTDVGWAGPRAALQQGRALSSAGVGLSVLDGMLRLDVARATRTGAWKLHLHVNGVL